VIRESGVEYAVFEGSKQTGMTKTIGFCLFY